MPKKTGPAPSLPLLKEFLAYNPEDGLFRWLKRANQNGSAEAGSVAGSPRDDDAGYIRIKLKGVFYQAHRVAWLYIHEEWPPEEIDHINGDPSDNRIVNLRCATPSQQGANRKRRSDNQSGYKGVYWHKPTSKWLAYIYRGGPRIDLGYFDDPAMAHAAYISAAESLFGEFAYDGVSNRAEMV
jgi:hypothetical protein